MEPTAASERIILLDVLRGVAIFGMFTVNMTADLPWGSAFREQPLDLADGIVMIFIDLFTNGKFITMFSFLFGVGVFLQLERARNRGIPFLAIYLRRLAALLLIAMVATVLGFGVSILIDYALFGLLLLLFYKQSARFLVVTAMICFVISVVSTNSEAVTSLIHTGQSEQVAFVDDDSNADASAEDERDRIYADGSFREIASFRAVRTVAYLRTWLKPPWELSILGLMLLGGYVCRRGAIQNPAVRLKMARRVLPWLLGIGATSMVIFVWLSPWPTADTELLTLIGNLAFWPFGAPVLGLGYVAIITLVMEKEASRRVLLLFVPVGRMALTNYLFHAFVGAAFTYQWGLGLYGEMGPFWGLMAVFAIFPLMTISSAWWIRRFQFGPAEWLWRTLTYGHIQSFRGAPRPGA